jgi:hypothetical protein
MAYDEALAKRIRDLLRDRRDVTERKMFGGLAFLVTWIDRGVRFARSLPETARRPARPARKAGR